VSGGKSATLTNEVTMESLTKLYDEGGRDAIRDYAARITPPDELASMKTFLAGWFAAQESYGVGVYAER